MPRNIQFQACAETIHRPQSALPLCGLISLSYVDHLLCGNMVVKWEMPLHNACHD